VQVHKLSSTDGFIAFDLGDGPAVGVVRVAPTVLRDGAELLARSTTYAAASFGLRVGGGSAGLNAKPDARDEAIAAFTAEVAELVESGRWLPGAGVGISGDELAGLPKADQRSTAFDPTLTGESAAAATFGALGSLDGKTVAVVGTGPVAAAAAASLRTNGATAFEQASFDAEADVLLVGGKAGVLDHEVAGSVRAKLLVPLSPVPVTARAHAMLGRAGTVVVPDFLALAAPLLAAFAPDAGDPVERVHRAVDELVPEGTDLWITAVTNAEEQLLAWQDTLPAFRPLA
jgi:glutamate dehydrogenase/leucine dehydrogenase